MHKSAGCASGGADVTGCFTSAAQITVLLHALLDVTGEQALR